MVVISGLLGVVTSPTEPAGAQTPPTPDRPLLIIGGTLVGHDMQGLDANVDGDFDDPEDRPGWDAVRQWLQSARGYDPTCCEPGDTNRNDSLLIGEMRRQDETPPLWNAIVPWDVIVNGDGLDLNGDGREDTPGVYDYGLSTAGYAPMLGSMVDVANVILVAATLADDGQIDVMAHSQGAAIVRAAIRYLAQPPPGSGISPRYPVHTFISLGGQNYGISTQAPDFPDIGNAALSEAVVNDCRENGPALGVAIPVCPDVVRKEDPDDLDGDTGNPPLIPDPNNPDPDFYRTNFYPWLNGPATPQSPAGPLPGATSGQTRYYHLYSEVFEPGGGIETQSGERIKLFPAHPHMAQGRNWCVQAVAALWDQGPNYPLHHNDEIHDVFMRLVIGLALDGEVHPEYACS